jgi:hypothetical protein
MENRILIASCSHYLREYVRNGLYYLQRDFYTRMLYKNYEVYNLSQKSLTSRQAQILIRAFLKNSSFSYCVLSLGEGDQAKGIEVEEFYNNLKSIIEMLLENHVMPVVEDTVDKTENKDYQRVIEKIRDLYNLKIYSYKRGVLIEA